MSETPHVVLQFLRFGIAGVIVTSVNLGLGLLLSGPLGLPIQVAIPIAYLAAISVHFVLQRVFVFAHVAAFDLTVGEQARRYVVIAAVQYGVTALSTAILPGLLDVDERVVYVCAALLITAATFVVLRTSVFHKER